MKSIKHPTGCCYYHRYSNLWHTDERIWVLSPGGANVFGSEDIRAICVGLKSLINGDNPSFPRRTDRIACSNEWHAPCCFQDHLTSRLLAQLSSFLLAWSLLLWLDMRHMPNNCRKSIHSNVCGTSETIQRSYTVLLRSLHYVKVFSVKTDYNLCNGLLKSN